MIPKDLLSKIEFKSLRNYKGFKDREMLGIFGKNFQTSFSLQKV